MTQPDRHHGSAVLQVAWSMAVGSLVTMAAVFAGVAAGRLTAGYALASVAGGIGAGMLTYWSIGQIAQRTAAGVLRFVHPGGRPATGDSDFSRQDTLIVRGQLHEALASFERFLAEHPGHVGGTLRVAALNAQLERWDDAAAAYNAARSHVTATPADRLHATQRLIDLYLGPLADEGASLRELRRLIDTFPDSAVAAGARQAIVAIKRARHPITE
jgi:hypothetical protein